MASKLSQSTKKKLHTLNQRIMRDPLYQEIVSLLPDLHTIQKLTVIEHSGIFQFNPSVSYSGLSMKTKQEHMLFDCCGLHYFIATKDLKTMAQEAEAIVKEVRASKPEAKYLDLHVSSRLADLWQATDEVYPHMRQNAIGILKIHC